VTVADLDYLIAQYEERLAHPPAYAGDLDAGIARDRLGCLRLQREQAATRQYTTAA
jgi:hypothetical protein